MLQQDREKPLPSRDEVKAILQEKISFEKRKRIVDLMGARNRITAEDIFAERTLPTSLTYKEDGIAINFAEMEILKKKQILVEGVDYIDANQGWPVKEPFATVIPLNEVKLQDGKARVIIWPEAAGAHLSKPGDIMVEGELLVPRYTVIDGPVMGLLAMGGIQAVTVFSRPRIIFIPTGDELVSWQETEVEPGKNTESNSVMVYGFAEELRCKLEIMPIIPDDEDALEDALHYAKELADLVIISAGTSKGKMDFTKRILAEEGELIIEEVGCDPGRYLTVTKLKNTPILSLPGSPKGVELTLGFYLPTIINKYYHQPNKVTKEIEVIADFGYRGKRELDSCLEIVITLEDDGNYHGRLLTGRNLVKGTALESIRGIYYLSRGQQVELGEKILVELH